MTTLSEYQKNVLSELGITQWILREHAESSRAETQPTSNESGVNAKHTAVSNKDLALAKLASLKQSEQPASADTQAKTEQLKTEVDHSVPETRQPELTAIDLATNHPLVQDVATYLCLTGNIEDKTQLALKWIEADTISLDGHTLTTPGVTELAQSAEYKKQLWQALQRWTA